MLGWSRGTSSHNPLSHALMDDGETEIKQEEHVSHSSNTKNPEKHGDFEIKLILTPGLALKSEFIYSKSFEMNQQQISFFWWMNER